MTTPTPTAPLPPAAVEALDRLSAAFAGRSSADLLADEAGSLVPVVTPEVQSALARFESAGRRAAQLAQVALSGRMTDLEARSLAEAEGDMAAAKTTLDAVGMFHLSVTS